ncbi:MAG: thiamine phosphate synthase [Lachnospiraceae bacterium]|nr:thiamine phosphate synthase [Lachnospiraceae bacterium]
MKVEKSQMLLYAVTDSGWLNGRSLAEDVIKALKGGATFLQLREKELDRESILKEAIEIKQAAVQFGVPFVINDDPAIAKECDADGVHVGLSDAEIGKARELLGPDKIIGASAHNVEEALQAQAEGADYLGVGSVFTTSTKKNVQNMPKETLKAICEAVDIPVVAIGGINENNVDELCGTGVDGVAVVSAIFAKEDIEMAAANLRQKALKVRGW